MTIDETIARTRAVMLDIVAASWERAMGRACCDGMAPDAVAQLDADYRAELANIDVVLARRRESLMRALGPDGDVPETALDGLDAPVTQH